MFFKVFLDSKVLQHTAWPPTRTIFWLLKITQKKITPTNLNSTVYSSQLSSVLSISFLVSFLPEWALETPLLPPPPPPLDFVPEQEKKQPVQEADSKSPAPRSPWRY